MNPILAGAAALAALSVVLFAVAGLAWEVAVIAIVALGMVYLATRSAGHPNRRHDAPAINAPIADQKPEPETTIPSSPPERLPRVRTFLGIGLGLAAGSGGVFWALQNRNLKSTSFQWFDSALATVRQLGARRVKKARP